VKIGVYVVLKFCNNNKNKNNNNNLYLELHNKLLTRIKRLKKSIEASLPKKNEKTSLMTVI